MSTPVYLEVGSKKVFACSVDWPGWARAARTEDEALEALARYADRYRPAAEAAGVRFPKSAGKELDVVERVRGDATTDFGAPSQWIAADSASLTQAQAERLASLVEGAWAVFDNVRRGAAAELRRGPRGGGRDRDKMVAHVLDAETAYFGKVGVEESRDAFLDACAPHVTPSPSSGRRAGPGATPPGGSPGTPSTTPGRWRTARSSRRSGGR